MKYCTSCGKELKNEANYCTGCGNKCPEILFGKQLTTVSQDLPKEKDLPYEAPSPTKDEVPKEETIPEVTEQEKTSTHEGEAQKSKPIANSGKRGNAPKGRILLFTILCINIVLCIAIIVAMTWYFTGYKEKTVESITEEKTTAYISEGKSVERQTVQETTHSHRWEEATYNEPKTCRTCGRTEGTKKIPVSMLGLRDIISSSSASSVYSGDNLGRHGPENLYDGKLNTNWTENKSGTGIGEYVTFYFDSTYAVKKLEIYTGSHYSEGVYRQNCRPKVINLTFSDGSTERITLDDSYSAQIKTFDKFYYTDYVTLTIEDVYTGTKYLDTVIAELDFVAYKP